MQDQHWAHGHRHTDTYRHTDTDTDTDTHTHTHMGYKSIYFEQTNTPAIKQ